MRSIPWTPAEEAGLLAWLDKHSGLSWKAKAAAYSRCKPRSIDSIRLKAKHLRRGKKRQSRIRNPLISRRTAAMLEKRHERRKTARQRATLRPRSRSHSRSRWNDQSSTEEQFALSGTTELPPSHAGVSHLSSEPDPRYQPAEPWSFPWILPFRHHKNHDQMKVAHDSQSIIIRMSHSMVQLPLHLFS